MLPSMTLLTFVENAVKHGLSKLPDDVEKTLKINIRRHDKGVRIEVIDNGHCNKDALKRELQRENDFRCEKHRKRAWLHVMAIHT